MYVLAPAEYAGGYSGQGAIKLLDEGYGGVYWYHKDELQSCNVKSKAVTRVRARQQIMANQV
jgi:hypothetical protein